MSHNGWKREGSARNCAACIMCSATNRGSTAVAMVTLGVGTRVGGLATSVGASIHEAYLWVVWCSSTITCGVGLVDGDEDDGDVEPVICTR